MYHYALNCIGANLELLEDMIEKAQGITWDEIVKYIPEREVVEMFGDCPHPRDDWAIRFYKSFYDSQDCYFIDHSAIEYIFLS